MNLVELAIVCVLGLYAIEVRADCAEDNWDAWKVGKGLQQGLSKGRLLQHMKSSAHELTPERMQAIRALVEDAYLYQPAQAEAWWKLHYKVCSEEREV